MKDWQATRLVSICEKHKLPENEKDFWISRLRPAPETICEHILNLFEDYPGEMRWLYTVQRKKEIAMAEGAQSAWENVLEDEQNHILAVLSSSHN